MDEIDRLCFIHDFLKTNHPALPDWAIESIQFQAEFSWEAFVKINGNAPLGSAWENFVLRVCNRLVEDFNCGLLARIQ
mgnify:CR=1 FL=1